jgi:hypothetical protein
MPWEWSQRMWQARTFRHHQIVLVIVVCLIFSAVVACGSKGGGGGGGSGGGGACTPTYGAFGASTWPPACWKPYAPESPFNQKVPANVVESQQSKAIVDFILQSATNKYPNKITVHSDGTQDGEPTYWVRSDDASLPKWTIHCTVYACPGVEGVSIPIPAGAVTENGSDHHMTIVDQTTNTEYDLWRVEQSQVPIGAAGGSLNVDSAASLPATSGEGIEQKGNATASYFGSLAGRVRAEEVRSGTIDHALFIVLKCHSGQAVYPAKFAPSQGKCGTVPANTSAPPMGSWLQLQISDSEINALPEWQRPYVKAMATYGMYFGDTGVQGYFGIEAETGSQYTSRGGPNPWAAWAQDNEAKKLQGWSWYSPDNDWVGTWSGVDWTKLHVLCQPNDTNCPRIG